MSAQFDHVSVLKKSNVYFGGLCISHVVQFEDGTKKPWESFYRLKPHLHLKHMCLSVWKSFPVSAVCKLQIAKKANCSVLASLSTCQAIAV